MKFVKTTDDSIGGRLLDTGEIITAIVKDGRNVITKKKATPEQLDNIINNSVALFYELKFFFDNILNHLPCVIEIDGNDYVKTEQRAPSRAATDRIYYEWIGEYFEDDEQMTKRVYQFEAPTIGEAKKLLRKALREDNWIK